ncbi:MAG: alpha/beta fold hydrolase [Rhodobacteraceae bacterium]|nr:alpha/beta fold hydrolase [Paracoccaceae bacterium]
MTDIDLAYANGAFIPGADTYPIRWAAEAEAFRTTRGFRAQLGLAYGPGARQWLDLFMPEGTPRGLMVFIHGGYWMSFGPRDWSQLAQGALDRGWACALPGYTLAPEARISTMTTEIGRAIARAAQDVAGPIALTGHSAGGHLSARMACADAPLPPEVAARIARVVPISPLSDLRPLMATAMNATLHLDAAEAAAESPALLPRRAGSQVTVWVGGAERPAFLDQAHWLADVWACPCHVAPRLHHFNVIEDLARPDSVLVETLLGGL